MWMGDSQQGRLGPSKCRGNAPVGEIAMRLVRFVDGSGKTACGVLSGARVELVRGGLLRRLARNGTDGRLGGCSAPGARSAG